MGGNWPERIPGAPVGVEVEGMAFAPSPLSPEQEAASFRVVSPSGGEIEGHYVDGAEVASYVITGRSSENQYGPPNIMAFIRSGADVVVVARMLRVMADELEKQKAPEGSDDPFEGIETQ